jgi:hypothetical protein
MSKHELKFKIFEYDDDAEKAVSAIKAFGLHQRA